MFHGPAAATDLITGFDQRDRVGMAGDHVCISVDGTGAQACLHIRVGFVDDGGIGVLAPDDRQQIRIPPHREISVIRM